MLNGMRRLAVFVVGSIGIFLGLLALLIAVAIAEGHGLLSCREDCSPSQPVLGEIPLWRTIAAVLLSFLAGAILTRRYASR
jgi:hypothetical protein